MLWLSPVLSIFPRLSHCPDPSVAAADVPNEWVWRVAAAFPDVFVPVASVHPYRKDALQQLQHWADKVGAPLTRASPAIVRAAAAIETRLIRLQPRAGHRALTGAAASAVAASARCRLAWPAALCAPRDDQGTRMIKWLPNASVDEQKRAEGRHAERSSALHSSGRPNLQPSALRPSRPCA
jgi:hypothetical protein